MATLNDDLYQFFGAHISRASIVDFFYKGAFAHLNEVIDSSRAIEWEQKAKPYMAREKYEVLEKGKVLVLEIPCAREGEEGVDVTKEFQKYLYGATKDKILSDAKYSRIMAVTNIFKVKRYSWGCCYEKGAIEGTKLDFKKSTTATLDIGEHSFDLAFNLDVKLDRRENALLLIKESQMGYFDFRTHSLIDTQDGVKKEQMNYKIGRDVVIKMDKTGNVISVDQKITEYDLQKDWGKRMVICPDGSRVEAAQFTCWKEYKEADGTVVFELYGAYTHVLRDVMGFIPLTWQFELLMRWVSRNFVAGCRRAGKTTLSVYIILRELWRSPHKVNHNTRVVKIAYYIPYVDDIKEVVDYIATLTDKLKLLKLVEYIKDTNRLVLKSERLGMKNTIASSISGSCDFYHVERKKEPGRGKALDLVIVDEAAYTKDKLWTNITPIIYSEWAKCYCISTIKADAGKNWYYDKLIEAEAWLDKDEMGMRVTIDDVDDWLIPPENKAAVKNALINKPADYYAELYCTFADLNVIFETENIIVHPNALNEGQRMMNCLIAYDPARNVDAGAVLISEYRINNLGGYALSTEEFTLQGDYNVQVQFLKDLVESKKRAGFTVELILDSTGPGLVVADMLGVYADYKITYSTSRKPTNNNGSWTISKAALVLIAQITIQKGMYKASPHLKSLFKELPNFKSFRTPWGHIQYEADVGHDDFVNAMMLTCFWIWYMSGGILDALAAVGIVSEEKQYIDKTTGLYNIPIGPPPEPVEYEPDYAF